MAITLTETAADRVKHFLQQTPAEGLRLAVKKTGCSGWAYVVGVAKTVETDDRVFEDRGIKVIVNGDYLEFLDGTEVDYRREGLNETFKFKNPNVVGECGCGESFNVE